MFESLSQKLGRTFQKLLGKGQLTDDNMRETMEEVRVALLEADVAYEVVDAFLADLQNRARGMEIKKGLDPAKMLIKVVNDALVSFLGDETVALNLQAAAPVVMLLVGLQGSGKTTSTIKLARLLKEKHKKRVLVVSVDIYRPAAMEQLAILAEQAGVACCPASPESTPEQIASLALQQAKNQVFDVLLVDTAGRLHVDEPLMAEVEALQALLKPQETLFVADGMMGQEAARTARSFSSRLPLTGLILTKMDGDSRGGAILSIKFITQKPVKFIGVGEKIDALEVFAPERAASRILGMGDILSLIEDMEKHVDQKQAENLVQKLQSGQDFNLEDFRLQLIQMQNMGGMASMMDKLPGMANLPAALREKAQQDKSAEVMLVLLNSMTPLERKRPILLQQGSRKRRITQGSGKTLQDFNRMMKQYGQMQEMMRKFAKGGLSGMMKQAGALMGGKMPSLFGK